MMFPGIGVDGPMRKYGNSLDVPGTTGLPSNTFMQHGDIAGMMSYLQAFQNAGMSPTAADTPVPRTRTFGGFKGPEGLLPVGQFSQQAQGLRGNARLSQFLDPGPAWGSAPRPMPSWVRDAVPQIFPGLFGKG